MNQLDKTRIAQEMSDNMVRGVVNMIVREHERPSGEGMLDFEITHGEHGRYIIDIAREGIRVFDIIPLYLKDGLESYVTTVRVAGVVGPDKLEIEPTDPAVFKNLEYDGLLKGAKLRPFLKQIETVTNK